MKNIISGMILLFLIPIICFGQSEHKKTIYFANDSATLDQKSIKSIDSLVSICSNQTDFSISLFGHTDDVGSNEYNKGLSERRVSAVMDYFLTKNLPANKVHNESFGETKPFTSNESENNRAKNRRVEIELNIRKVEDTIIIPEDKNEDKDTIAWPGENAIVVRPGTRAYKVPGTLEGRVKISVINTTMGMEPENFTTVTTDGTALTSNVIFCVRGPIDVNCELPQPIKIYIPVSSNPFCKVPDVKFYDAEKDSIGNRSIKWREIPPRFTVERYDGDDYFVLTITDLCGIPCKNFDCTEPRTGGAKIKLKGRKYTLSQVDAIHENANALLPGKEISKNQWLMQYLDFPGIETPTIKLIYVNKKTKKSFVKKFKLTDLKRDSKLIFVVTKKQVKAD
jgi:hypothetical protein